MGHYRALSWQRRASGEGQHSKRGRLSVADEAPGRIAGRTLAMATWNIRKRNDMPGVLQDGAGRGI
eukprot:2259924-Alexandrium_andersonii.AAC.1